MAITLKKPQILTGNSFMHSYLQTSKLDYLQLFSSNLQFNQNFILVLLNKYILIHWISSVDNGENPGTKMPSLAAVMPRRSENNTNTSHRKRRAPFVLTLVTTPTNQSVHIGNHSAKPHPLQSDPPPAQRAGNESLYKWML
ncbi:hypothetical protein ACX1HT_22345 [Yersinia enterocolitica]